MNHNDEPRKGRTDMPSSLGVSEGRWEGALIASASSSVGGVCVGDMSRSDVRVNWESCLIGSNSNLEYKS